MNFGPRSIAFGTLFCISSLLAAAQQTPCSTDGQPAAGAIACVTGNGVIVTANTPVDAPQEVLPLTPEQRPAAAPIVIYLDGKLSISAKNSTLSDVLRAIANKTGANIDVPEDANERIVSQLGPAPARDVIASLLNGSHFNYVMVGTENDANSVARVVLTAKSDKGDTGNGSGAAVASNRPNMVNGRPMVQPRNALQAAVMQPYQDMLAAQQAQQEAMENQQSITPAEPTPVANDAPPGAVSAASAPADTTTVDPPPAPETPRAGNGSTEKTPTQVLQDLYETRRQMMEQQQKAQQQTPQQ
jgi:hypothetical protein